MKQKPTLRTRANETGFAVTTVSRALNDAPEIALETRQRVHEAAQRIGYRPDRAAQRLKTGKTKVIAFLLEPHEEMLGFGTRMIAGIVASLRPTDYHLVVVPQFSDEPPIEAVRKIVNNWNADGLIFCRTRPFDDRVRYLLEEQFPFVCHGRTELSTSHAFVDFDNYEFALLAARKLLSSGRKHIALIGAPKPYTYCRHMLHGFMTAVSESGVRYETPSDIDIASPPEMVASWVTQAVSRGIDGIVCGGESSVLTVLSALSELGLSAGKDVGIVYKQTTPLFDKFDSRAQPIFEDLECAGRELGSTLLAILSKGPTAASRVIHSPG